MNRWRIRQKLFLALVLVIAILGLLVTGTLRGLWSYYQTTNSIRAKLDELAKAEELHRAVARLVSPDTIPDLIRAPNKLEDELAKVREALGACEEQLEKTLASGRDSSHGQLEQACIQSIQGDLEAFQKVVLKRPMATVGSVSTEEARKRDRAALEEPGRTLELHAMDLRNHIRSELDRHLGETRSHYQISLWIVVPSSVVGMIVVCCLMLSFYRWVLNPIHDLELGVGRVAKGDLKHRILLNSGDEMQDLATAFNSMLTRLNELYDDLARQVNERSRQLVRSERLASVGFLAAGVAHEINNPLAGIAFCSEALEARLEELMHQLKPSGGEHAIFSKYLKMIQEEAFRCKKITERLLEFSRTGEPKREAADLRELVQAVLDVTQHLPNHKGKHITFEVPAANGDKGRITAWVNGDEIKAVILNLVVNALESMEEHGRLTIRLGQRDGRAEIRFMDTGCGMPREVLENIFEPFFTRSRAGKGTGLGLTISHLIISQHGGEIEASSAGVGQGSTFSVRLPIQATTAVEMTIGQAEAANTPTRTARAA